MKYFGIHIFGTKIFVKGPLFVGSESWPKASVASFFPKGPLKNFGEGGGWFLKCFSNHFHTSLCIKLVAERYARPCFQLMQLEKDYVNLIEGVVLECFSTSIDNFIAVLPSDFNEN